MRHALRTLFLLFTIVLLSLPLSASSALPVGIAVVLTIAGAAWQGFNLLVVGARSAAIAQADEILVSDPPNIRPDEFDDASLESDTAHWNTGRASAVSIAPAIAPSGNAITITAETNWEPISFTFSPKINMTSYKLANADGVLWGKGFAFGTLEGIVTKEFDPRGRGDEAEPTVSEIPFRYTISEISIPYEESLSGILLNLKIHAWKMDDLDTEPEDLSWNQQILLTSISLDGPSLNYLQVKGDLNMDDFVDIGPNNGEKVNLRLEEPIDQEVLLRVPFPVDSDPVALAFRVEVDGTFQIGKR